MKDRAVIFENDFGSADLLSERLRKLGFDSIVVSDGWEGIEAVYQNKPKIIFLNPAALKGISDYQICRLLKNNKEYQNIPIIIVTDAPNDKLKFWSAKSGADDYLIKPLNIETIDIQLKNIIKRFTTNTAHNNFLDRNRQFVGSANDLAGNYHGSLNPDPVDVQVGFQALIENIAVMLKSETASLMLADKEKNALIIKAAVGLSEEIIRNTTVKPGQSISGWVAKHKQPLLIYNIEEDSNFYKKNDEKYHTKSFISVPLNAGEMKGVINVTNKVNRQIYNGDDLALLQLLAGQIVFAFENAEIKAGNKKTEERLDRANGVNEILTQANRFLEKELYEATISDEVNKIITANLDYHQTINAVIAIVEQFVDFYFCGLLLVNEASNGELIASVKYPATEDEFDKFKLRVVDAFNERANEMIAKENVRLNYANNFPVIAEDLSAGDVLNSFQAKLLHNADKVIGLLAMSHSREDAFSEEDLKLFSIVAQRFIPAINNAALHRKIKELSTRDDLTGLFRYGYLQDQLDRELVRADRYQVPLGVIMLDIDNFKGINDAYGHQQGDMILKELSSILNKICRTVDIIARYGGEEFMIVLPETDRDGAYYLAERIRRVIKNYDFSSFGREPLKITVSLGVVSYPSSAVSKQELLKKVDTALYQAKHEGKNATVQV